MKTLKRVPFILEVRDIWPESIRAVGATQRPLFLRVLERIERQMYVSASRIVTVGEGYKAQLVGRGVIPSKIAIVTNGVDREMFVSPVSGTSVRDRYGLGSSFVCAYVGTIGMAAGLDVAVRAASILKERGRDDIKFLLVGDGATREALERDARHRRLDNVIIAGRVDRGSVPGILAAVDACLVHLRKRELFESVLPSKIFEAAGMGKPIILGIRGQAAELLERAGGGILIEPEDENALVAAVERLAADPDLGCRLGIAGRSYVHAKFDRDTLSKEYLDVIHQTIGG